jgi:hypothetical protein
VQASPQVLHRSACRAREDCGWALTIALVSAALALRPGAPRLILRTPHFAQYLRWGRLALLLLFGAAGVDRAVELVVRQLALDVLAGRLQLAAGGELRLLRERGRVELVEV